MRTILLPIVLILSLIFAGCAAFSTTSAPTTAKPTNTISTGAPIPQATASVLDRPLHVPTIAPGSPCPAAHGHTVSPDYGLALGDGPAYPIGLGETGTLIIGPAHNFSSQQWGGNKVLWALDTTHYDGPVLIRGHQIDGPNELRFGFGDIPPLQLWITPNPGDDGWIGLPSYTRLRATGCYAYQIDGTSFSKVIIFQATGSAT